jgi:hypothetical protein
MKDLYPFVRPSEDGEVQEAERTNEQLCKILEAVDDSACPLGKFIEPEPNIGGPWGCPFCVIVADQPYQILHQDDCIVLVARQVMRDADMETSMDRYEKELERNEEL